MTAKLTLDEKVMMAIPTMTDEQLAMTKNFIRAEERKRGTFSRKARRAQAEVLVGGMVAGALRDAQSTLDELAKIAEAPSPILDEVAEAK